jgi:uncharacterized protein (TIGR02001 family)
LVALLGLASVCHAQTLNGLLGLPDSVALGGSLGLATDDVVRGVTQNDGQLSPQGDLHLSAGPWYGGVTAEGVRRGINASASAGAELIGYLGWQQHFGDDWSGGITLRHYDYPGNQLRTRYNYDELGVSLGWRERVVATVIASPDTYSQDYLGHYGSGAAYCYEMVGRQPLMAGLAAVAGVGYYDLRRQIGVGYAYWSAGVEHRWRSLAFDLRYVGTDATARQRFEDDAGNRVVLSAFWLF